MNKAEFDAIFESRVGKPLRPLGFNFLGKTLALRDAEVTISLTRLGGRWSTPGGIVHVLCFRHSCLRGLEDTVAPDGIPANVFDYPYKFAPSELLHTPESSRRYSPRNVDCPQDTYMWCEHEKHEVELWLDELAFLVGNRFLSRARSIGKSVAAEELREFGEGAWCEKRWIEDYRDFGSTPGV